MATKEYELDFGKVTLGDPVQDDRSAWNVNYAIVDDVAFVALMKQMAAIDFPIV